MKLVNHCSRQERNYHIGGAFPEGAECGEYCDRGLVDLEDLSSKPPSFRPLVHWQLSKSEQFRASVKVAESFVSITCWQSISYSEQI